MSSWRRGQTRRRRSGAPARRVGQTAALRIEALEARTLMSAEGLQSVYEAGAAQIGPQWFAQLGQSDAAQLGAGTLTVEQTVGATQWKGAAVDAYLDEWIIQLTSGALQQYQSVADVANLFSNAGFGVEVIGGTGLAGQVLIRANDVATQTVAAWLGGNTSIAYYEPNSILPLSQTANDPSYSQLWGLSNTGQTVGGQTGTAGADINATQAWSISTGSNNVVVGVIDTGIDYTHSDLAANVWTNPGEIAGNGIDDDGDGFIDDVHGYDFVNNDGNPMDDNGHGTHVAGTIAAVGNNGTGVTGVNWNTTVMALKFLDANGSGSLYDAVRAINYATMMRTRYGVNVLVTNNSWGGGSYDQSLCDAIAASGQAGILFVAAAGNAGSNNDASPSYPASYNLNNIISVAATDNRDNLASFSNYGATTVDLAAPGVNILSTKPGGGYQYLSGTSMATPFVSGVAALAWSVDPTASVAEIRAALLGGVDHLASLSGKVASGGRLDAYGTLQLLGMQVSGSTPAAGGVLSSPPTAFTVDFSQNYDPATVQAADLTVNGIAANSFSLVDANTITFRFNASPVTAQGAQTMRIAAGAIGRQGGGAALTAWQATFNYDQMPMAVTAATPGNGQTLSSAPTTITLTFNEAVAPGSIGAGDLTLSAGTVTAATLINANTVRYTVSVPSFNGQLTYTLNAGAVTDVYGNAGPRYVGQCTINDPSLLTYTASGLPAAIPDQGTVRSQITITDNFTIRDLDLALSINHTWDGDLAAVLIAPDGTRIRLFTHVGAGGQGFSGTVFDDQATTAIGSGSAPFTGRFRAQDVLAALNGKSTAGTWTLEISDGYQDDTGTLTGWSLQFRVNQPPQQTAIPAQTISHNSGSVTVPLAATDPEGSPVTFSARAVSAAYGADQTFGLWADALRISKNYYLNATGRQEKWLCGANGNYYCLLPNGELYRAVTSIYDTALVAKVDPSCYADPATLYNAVAGSVPATVTVDAASQRLTITPSAGYTGSFYVEVSASDGTAVSRQYVQVNVANQAPQLAPIADQTIAPQVGSVTVQLAASDADGDRLTYSATAVGTPSDTSRDVAQQFGLWADALRVTKNYYLNATGRQEKWLCGANSNYYCLLPNGELYRMVSSIYDTALVAKIDASYYADPSKLWDVQGSQVAVTAAVDAAGKLTVTPPAGFVGDISVTVNVSDGAATASRTFTLHVANQSPVLAPIADQTVAPGAANYTVQLAASDADGDRLTYSATAVGLVSNHTYEVDQQFGLWADALRVTKNYYFNATGRQEKWLCGANGNYYCLLPNGELYHAVTSIYDTALVAKVDAGCYADPAKLYNAEKTQVAVAVAVDAAGKLTLTPPTGFVGDISVTASASDGVATASRSFTLHVVNQAPVLGSLPDRTVAPGAGKFEIQLSASDADGDRLTFGATAVGLVSNAAYQIDQQFGLWADAVRVTKNYYLNATGRQEKWLCGANGNYYCLLPNGELYRAVSSIYDTTLVAKVDTSYYADPAKLYDAQMTQVAVSASVDAAGKLTLIPPASFVGDINVTVTASDGTATVSRSFTLHVTRQTQSAAADVGNVATSTVPGVLSPTATAVGASVIEVLGPTAHAQSLLAAAQPPLAASTLFGVAQRDLSRPSTGSAAVPPATLAATAETVAAADQLGPFAGLRVGDQLLHDAATLKPLALTQLGDLGDFQNLADGVFASLDANDWAILHLDSTDEVLVARLRKATS